MTALKTYRVKHILVKHKYEAEDLLRKLNAGSVFEDLAYKFSICPTGPTGGDMGKLKLGQADVSFEEATLKLKAQETTTSPVRTQFGYHLIKRIE